MGCVTFEKAIRHSNGVVKLDRRIGSSGAKLGDGKLRTLKYLSTVDVQ